MTMFEKVVALYREAGKPPIQDGQFTYNGKSTPVLLELIDDCRQLSEQFGRLTYVRVKDPAGAVNIEFMLPASDSAGFYSSFDSFIKATPSLGHGRIPEFLYIANEDWSSTDKIQNENFEKIKKCCKLISNLAKIAMAADDKSSSSHINLIFAVPADNGKPPKTFTIPTKVSPNILEFKLKHLALIDQLANPKNESKLHLEERKSILNLAISEIISNAPESAKSNLFIFTLSQWTELLDTYWKNFQTYIHGFSFEKVKKDLAQAELDHGTKLSAAFSDIGGKLFALPVSLGALVILEKAQTSVEKVATATGILMVSMIFTGILINQWLNIKRLNSSLNIVLTQIDKKNGTYPKNIQTLLENSKKEILTQQRFIKGTIGFFLFLSWAPTIGMLIMKWPQMKPSIDTLITKASHTLHIALNYVAQIISPG